MPSRSAVEQSRSRRYERFGITRWVVFADRPDLAPAEALVPVLERL